MIINNILLSEIITSEDITRAIEWVTLSFGLFIVGKSHLVDYAQYIAKQKGETVSEVIFDWSNSLQEKEIEIMSEI